MSWWLREFLGHEAGAHSLSGARLVWPRSFIFGVDARTAALRSKAFYVEMHRLAKGGVELRGAADGRLRCRQLCNTATGLHAVGRIGREWAGERGRRGWAALDSRQRPGPAAERAPSERRASERRASASLHDGSHTNNGLLSIRFRVRPKSAGKSLLPPTPPGRDPWRFGHTLECCESLLPRASCRPPLQAEIRGPLATPSSGFPCSSSRPPPSPNGAAAHATTPPSRGCSALCRDRVCRDLACHAQVYGNLTARLHLVPNASSRRSTATSHSCEYYTDVPNVVHYS